jgi:hypothetical protein
MLCLKRHPEIFSLVPAHITPGECLLELTGADLASRGARFLPSSRSTVERMNGANGNIFKRRIP